MAASLIRTDGLGSAWLMVVLAVVLREGFPCFVALGLVGFFCLRMAGAGKSRRPLASAILWQATPTLTRSLRVVGWLGGPHPQGGPRGSDCARQIVGLQWTRDTYFRKFWAGVP